MDFCPWTVNRPGRRAKGFPDLDNNLLEPDRYRVWVRLVPDDDTDNDGDDCKKDDSCVAVQLLVPGSRASAMRAFLSVPADHLSAVRAFDQVFVI